MELRYKTDDLGYCNVYLLDGGRSEIIGTYAPECVITKAGKKKFKCSFTHANKECIDTINIYWRSVRVFHSERVNGFATDYQFVNKSFKSIRERGLYAK